ncbi:MAG: hypothetical protein JW741_24995 [Sedimentisphaerales bacterium]|nr:hypothetical protein [Sedimentisphaerales bacterium]
MVVVCPHCRKRLKVSEDLAGAHRACPACGKVFTIPALPSQSKKTRPAAHHSGTPVAVTPVRIQPDNRVCCPWCKKVFRVIGAARAEHAGQTERAAQRPSVGASGPVRPAGAAVPPPLPQPRAVEKPSVAAAAPAGPSKPLPTPAASKTLPAGLGRALRPDQVRTAKAHARKYSPALFGLVLLCFCFPFTHISCQGDRVATFSGVQLVVGTRISMADMELLGQNPRASQQRVGREFWAILAFLSAGAGLAGFALKDRRRYLGGGIIGGVGVLTLLLLKLRIDDAVLREGEGVLRAEYGGGYYLAMLLFACAAALHGYLLWDAKQPPGRKPALPAP